MLKVISKRCPSWRHLHRNVNRLNKITPKVTILPSQPEAKDLRSFNQITFNKLDMPPAVHSMPFAELNDQSDQSAETPSEGAQSEISEFIDSLGPPIPIAFNLAAFVNRSESLQNLVHLGVDLSRIDEKSEQAKFILTLDFEKDMKRHIQFLHDQGVHADDLGSIITKNPFVFRESLEDLGVRMNYMKSKKFKKDAIARIITRNPMFLSWDAIKVDNRLGFFQKQFSLSGDEVRYVATKHPKLITYGMDRMREKLFLIKEEFGYETEEMKQLLLDKPKMFMLGIPQLRERFDAVHNMMGISHERILTFPGVFLKRGFILKQRHLYLAHLNRAQYDPDQPLYVSLQDIATTTDAMFCEKCARTSIEQYNKFLKTI